jgi:hypothetical protein
MSRDALTSVNRSRSPQRLSSEQIDVARGSLHWPAGLEAAEFDDARGRLDELFALRAARPYATGKESENCRQIQEAVDEFRGLLKAKIRELSADEFIAGDKFLKSLAFEARFQVIADSVASSETSQ